MLPVCFLAKCSFGDWRAVLFINRNHAFLISSHSNGEVVITAPNSSPLTHQSALAKMECGHGSLLHTWFLSGEAEALPQGKATFPRKQQVLVPGILEGFSLLFKRF